MGPGAMARGARTVAQQEIQRRAVERVGVLVESAVREILEDHQLAPLDPAVDPLRKSRRADKVMRSDGDQARNADLAEYRSRVVRHGRLGLGEKRVQRLCG